MRGHTGSVWPLISSHGLDGRSDHFGCMRMPASMRIDSAFM